jgi:uncharacterized protein (DUF1697 family)
MTAWVALLRGVNVGGANKLPMAGLREVLVALGLEAVATYIQSGNAVFRAEGTAAALCAAIGDAIATRFGFRPHVFVMPATAFDAALVANPFRAEAEADGAKVHLHFLAGPLPPGTLEALAPYATAGERAVVAGDILYLHTPGGLGQPGYAARLSRVKVPMTARNARSAAAIADLARCL